MHNHPTRTSKALTRASRPLERRVSGSPRVGNVYTATDGRDILENTPDGWEVERPAIWWDGPAGTDGGTGGPWGNPPPGARHPWQGTGALPAMARCRSLIVDALAGVPWQTFRGRDQIQTPAWIIDPQNAADDARRASDVRNVALSGVEFWSSVILSTVELGEGIVYSPILEPTDTFGSRGCFTINPADLEIEGDRYYINRTPIPAAELLIIRARVWPGKHRGRGVWHEFGTEIGLGNSIREYAGNMLSRGIPAGYLKVSAPDLNQGEADRLKERWMIAHGGNTRRIAVLNATTEFHPLQIDPQALQLAEMLRLSAWEIALIYGIPPYKLGISMGYSNTYANIESASIDYVQDALLPWVRRIEAAFDAVLPAGTTLKLNLDGLRRADTKTRFDAYAVALSNGWMTVDEIRSLEDLPPMTDLQVRTAIDYAAAVARKGNAS